MTYESHGTLVQVSTLGNRVTSTMDIPDWNPSWKTGFTEVVIGDQLFRKIGQVKLTN